MPAVEIRIKLDEDLMKAFDEIKTFYNLNSRTELLRLMLIRFYNHIQDEKSKGKDKFMVLS